MSTPAFDAFNKGVELSLKGDHARAIEAFDEALRLDPQHHVALSAKAMSLTQLGRPQEAIECFKQAIRIEPDVAVNFLHLGLTYLEVGDTERATIALKGAAELEPFGSFRKEAAIETYNFGGHLMIRAAHLRDAGQGAAEREHYRRALVAFSLALELDPELRAAEEAVARVRDLDAKARA